MVNQMNMRNKILGLGAILFCLITFVFTDVSSAQSADMNKNLKNVIEENQRLMSQNEALKKDQQKMSQTIEQISSKNRKYSQELEHMSERMKTLETKSVNSAQGDSKDWVQMASVSTTGEEEPAISEEKVIEREYTTLDLLSRIDAFTEVDERLRMDAAKAHYNMGNIYFQKGEYEIAAREYYQAVTLMPDDPDSHYNLAFVSGDHLNDFETALKHYKMYLYLRPGAKDKHIVQEKIIHANFALRSKVDSPLDK